MDQHVLINVAPTVTGQRWLACAAIFKVSVGERTSRVGCIVATTPEQSIISSNFDSFRAQN